LAVLGSIIATSSPEVFSGIENVTRVVTLKVDASVRVKAAAELGTYAYPKRKLWSSQIRKVLRSYLL
jgi:hypothetical protein